MRYIGTWDTLQGFYRLVRVVWVSGVVGDGKGYSAKVTLAVSPKFFSFGRSGKYDIAVTLFGIRFHHNRSYGGIMV